MNEHIITGQPGCTFTPFPPEVTLSKQILVPVLPYVAKYLEYHYPKGYVLSDSEPIGTLLTQLMRRPKEKRELNEYATRYSSGFLVHLPSGKAKNGIPARITSYTIVRFNSFLEAQIRQRMYDYVDFCKQYKVKKKAVAIREFMQRYGFTEDDVAYETFLKAYQRHEWSTDPRKEN